MEDAPAWLFVPADRPDRFQKAQERSSVVIIDLEDAVAAEDKAAARKSLVEAPLDPRRTVVRVNAAETADFELDLEAMSLTNYRHVMLPMVEHRSHTDALTDYGVIALVETAAGVRRCGEIAAVEHVEGIMFGAEDLVESLGGRSSRGATGTYTDAMLHAWSEILFCARSEGKFALDSVWIDIGDLEGLREEALRASGAGYSGKVAIHPSHVPEIRRSFAPSDELRQWAREVVDQAELSDGAFALRGEMVDGPVIARARRILQRERDVSGTKPNEAGAVE